MHHEHRNRRRKKVGELVRKATRAAVWGDVENTYEYSSYVYEYMQRSRLKRAGFYSSYDSLPWLKADMFLIIDATIDKIHAEESKGKATKKR